MVHPKLPPFWGGFCHSIQPSQDVKLVKKRELQEAIKRYCQHQGNKKVKTHPPSVSTFEVPLRNKTIHKNFIIVTRKKSGMI